LKVKCPNNPKHNQFVTTAHEVHDWLVDAEGNFIKDLGCTEIAHEPDMGNLWTCRKCGAEAVKE
jgi:cytochrome oxidase Cu insertion factor (SCO1/SenC/PrrC family)